MHVVTLLLRTTALLCVLFASSPLCADVWIAGDAQMAKVATSGQTLVTVDSVFGQGFAYGTGIQDIIGVDPRNGHVWVSDVNNNRVFQLNADGEPLREIILLSPFGIGIDANSGAVWTSILLDEVTFPRAVIKLDPDTGKELVRVTGFSRFVAAIAVGPSGQVWIADRFNNEVVVLFGTDKELDGYDTSTSSGSNHLRLGGFDEPQDIDIDPRNGSQGGESTWVADRNNGEAVKIASDGTELVRENPTGFFEVRFVSVNTRDGSVWVGDPNSGRVAKLSALGKEAQNLPIRPTALAVDVTDDALWVGTGFGSEARVLKLDSNGSELLSVSGLGPIRGIGAIRAEPGDLDGDGDVDRADIKLLLRDRGKSVTQSACGPPCDLDGDGQITALDARKLTLSCTRPGCATEQAKGIRR
jgi:streptogramin lyase